MKEYFLDLNTFMGAWYIPQNLCDSLINYFEYNKDYTKKGACGGKTDAIINKNYKDSLDLSIGKDNNDNIIGAYRKELQKVLDKYLDKFPASNQVAPFSILENYNMQKYSIGGGFKEWHTENNGEKSTINRHLVFMTYLNDVEDGGTEFKHQDIITPAEKGLTLIWPSWWTHVHRGQVSNKKEKYIVTGWYGFI